MTPIEFLKSKKEKNIINLNNLKVKKDVLWHGIKLEHASEGITNGYLPARTTQRYWEDGRYLKDNHEDYEKSGWMFGWSTTRDRNYAGSWGDVVFLFDRKKIKDTFSIKPLSWNYRIAQGSGYYKKEREDFIISYKDPRTLDEVQEDYYKIIDDENYDYKNSEFDNMYDYWYKHTGKTLDVSKNLIGILISDSTLNIYGKDNVFIKNLMNHEKFLGIYNFDSCEKNMEKQTNPAQKKDSKNRLIL